MKPPIVGPVISPSNHKITSTSASVYNINFLLVGFADWRAFAPAGNESKV
jgi:hypothetical protein